jgi:hypothetical protein
MKEDRSKLLIPCYRDMDAYDLPEEFSHLQAQDMGKIGFINDVVRGINKVLKKDEPQPTVQVVQQTTQVSANVENLLKRGNLALEDKKWAEADGFFEQVLNENVEEPRAYLGKLLAEYKVSNEKQLENCNADFSNSNNYKKAVPYTGTALNFSPNSIASKLPADSSTIRADNSSAHSSGSRACTVTPAAYSTSPTTPFSAETSFFTRSKKL